MPATPWIFPFVAMTVRCVAAILEGCLACVGRDDDRGSENRHEDAGTGCGGSSGLSRGPPLPVVPRVPARTRRRPGVHAERRRRNHHRGPARDAAALDLAA